MDTRTLRHNSIVHIGIDPGVSGAMAYLHVIDGSVVWHGISDFGGDGEPAGIISLLGRLSVHNMTYGGSVYAVIEQLGMRPGQAVQNMAKYARNKGMWLGYLQAMAIPYVIVNPQRWQKHFRQYIDSGLVVDTSGAKNIRMATKDAALSIARGLYPQLGHLLRFKKDHNRADALLMAEFCMRHKHNLEFTTP